MRNGDLRRASPLATAVPLTCIRARLTAGLTVAAIFEATMSREQAERLAELMDEARPTRPEGVVTAALHVEGDQARLVAYWRDRATLDA